MPLKGEIGFFIEWSRPICKDCAKDILRKQEEAMREREERMASERDFYAA